MPRRKVGVPAREELKEVEIITSRLLTLREVAAFLHVHPGTVYRLVKKGQLPGLRIGRDLRFQMRKVEEFIVKGGTATFDSGDRND